MVFNVTEISIRRKQKNMKCFFARIKKNCPVNITSFLRIKHSVLNEADSQRRRGMGISLFIKRVFYKMNVQREWSSGSRISDVLLKVKKNSGK